MSDLTQKQVSFIETMKKSAIHEQRGVELLLKRDDFPAFFDALSKAGLFDAGRNPAPVQVDDKSVQIPYWPILKYLVASARHSGDNNDRALAEQVMNVVRSVSLAGEMRNFWTARHFAEILGLVPTSVVTLQDTDLALRWLKAGFDRSMVAPEFDQGAIPKFLASDDPDDWGKAAQIVRHCTALEWRPTTAIESEEPFTLVEDYWLNELVTHHASTLGRRVPAQGAEIFEQRVSEVFSRGGRSKRSYGYRPAVEEHAQNHSWRGAENCFVVGLRDVVLSWADVDPSAAKTYVGRLLKSDVQMLRRIGLSVLDARWDKMHELFSSVLGPELFVSGHLHELHGILARHFESMTGELQAATLQAIRDIPLPEADDPQLRLRLVQLRWLSAIAETKHPDASAWIQELRGNGEFGFPEHPDFNSYMESSWGPGPSPFSTVDLIALVAEGHLVERLNEFQPQETFRGPSMEGLTDALQKAVQDSPEPFLQALPQFLDARRPYIHAVIQGFKELWGKTTETRQSLDWNRAWGLLFDFFEKLTGQESFWSVDQGTWHDSRSWILSGMADLLQSGTRDDAHSYPAELLPRGLALIGRLLGHLQPDSDSDSKDPMMHAINTTRGRTLEALFSHVLRACRVRDKEVGSHQDAWETIRPLFDAELELTKNGNFEFSTLAGAYVANMKYVSDDWVAQNLKMIFPEERAANLACAVAGLAFAPATKPLYASLRDAGILDRALATTLPGRDSRQKLIERVMLAFIWGEESLESSRFQFFFKTSSVDDLQDGAWYFWMLRGDTLNATQRGRIIAYWRACLDWAKQQPAAPTKLLGTLAHLAWTLDDLSEGRLELLKAVAPYIQVHHNLFFLLEELERLLDASPEGVGEVLKNVVDSTGPQYDYQDRIKKLILGLHKRGQKEAALYCCNKLITLPGMDQVFKQLTLDKG